VLIFYTFNTTKSFFFSSFSFNMADAVPLTSKEVYDPTAFTTIADLYAALKNEQLGIFERGMPKQ
jgi:hypothetical protein